VTCGPRLPFGGKRWEGAMTGNGNGNGKSEAKVNGSKVKAPGSGPDARLLMHEDEHEIVEAILKRVLDDDDCYAKVVSRNRSKSRRLSDRLVLATFLKRIERQFALRPLGARRSMRDLLGPSA
jgi:hypothetical protein